MLSNLTKFFIKKKPLSGTPNTTQLQSVIDTPMAGMLYLENWGNMTHGLTPSRLRSILTAADGGDIMAQQQLFSDMEEACEHLSAEIGKRKRALLTLNYEIKPGFANNAKAKSIAKDMQQLFSAIPYFEDVLLDMCDGIGHGFSAQEIEWDRQGKEFLPSALHFRPQTWFQTLAENRNELRLRNSTADGAELWPMGWLIHSHKSRSGWLPRYGLFRMLAWAFCIRQYALDCNITYSQVHGLPLRLGKYPPGSSEADKKALMQALRYLGKDAAGIIPEGMMVEFQSASTTTQDVPGMLVERCEKGMSKAILGGTLTSQADGQTSTNALGNIHNEVRHDILTSDAVQLAATINEQLIAPLAFLNFGISDKAYIPRFVFDTKQAENIAMFAEALPKLVPIMDISKAWAHERLKIPMAEKEDDILGGVKQVEEDGNDLENLDGSKPDKQGKEGKEENSEKPNNPPKEAPEKTRLALSKNAPQNTEDALEEVPAALSMESMTSIVLDAVKDGLSPQALEQKLAELYTEMDESKMAQVLAQAAFVAEVLGRLEE